MRGGAIGEVEHDLVDVTPAPAFGWIIAFDDRVARAMEVLRGVAVRRVVATADMAAGPAETQMDLWRTDFQAFLAAERARCHVANVVGVDAFVGHQCLPGLAGSAAPSPASARKACSAARLCALSDGSGNALDRT